MLVADKIGRPEVTTVHSLRHLFATLAEENGLNPLTVQTILGHSRLEMTKYYTPYWFGGEEGGGAGNATGQRTVGPYIGRTLGKFR